MKNRWSRFCFENGKIVQNRVVVPPMASQTATETGLVTSSMLEHYRHLSLSGAGLVFVEYSFIHPSGKSEPRQLGADDDTKVPGLTRLAAEIKSQGALAGLQLVHAGGKSDSHLIGRALLGPSAVAVPSKDRDLETPMAMGKKNIVEMVEWYRAAAERVDMAGFDIVEIHAAHGYGINQWLSPLTNQRTDEYGGAIEGRSRILFDVVEAIRMSLPNIMIAVRLPAQDHFEQGLLVTEMMWVATQLEKKGVDLIDVSSGLGGWRRPRGHIGQGYLVEDATFIKAAVQLPVIGVGGIQTGEFIDSIVEKESVDFAAVGRSILADPALWRKCQMEPPVEPMAMVGIESGCIRKSAEVEVFGQVAN